MATSLKKILNEVRIPADGGQEFYLCAVPNASTQLGTSVVIHKFLISETQPLFSAARQKQISIGTAHFLNYDVHKTKSM